MNPKMTILFTTFSYYPETSGVPIVVQYLAEGLSAKGHNVSVVTRKNGKDLPSIENINGVTIYRFDFGQNLFKIPTGEVKAYINFVISFKKDVLVMECLQCQTTDILLPLLKRMNCKVFLHTHGAPGLKMTPFAWEGDLLHSIGHIHNWLRWKYYYKFYFPRYCKGIEAGICLSLCSSDIAYLNKHLNRVHIVENAANPLFFDIDAQKEDISEVISIHSKRYILNISNYSDRKNQKLLIKEFTHSEVKDCALVLIGSRENEYSRLLRKKAQALSKKGKEVLILHGVSRRLFPAIIKNASVFVMTSKWEEYPVSLVESMSVGTPFISTPVGNSHILPGGVTSRENKEIRSLIRSFFSDQTLLERFGGQGIEYAYKYNKVEFAVGKFESVLLS